MHVCILHTCTCLHDQTNTMTRALPPAVSAGGSAAQALAQHWPGLKGLKLHNCDPITPSFFEGLSLVLHSMPRLETLVLEKCTFSELEEAAKDLVVICAFLGPRNFTIRGHGPLGAVVEFVAKLMKEPETRPPLLGGAALSGKMCPTARLTSGGPGRSRCRFRGGSKSGVWNS